MLVADCGGPEGKGDIGVAAVAVAVVGVGVAVAADMLRPVAGWGMKSCASPAVMMTSDEP
jgi:hypothetical protein